MKGYPHEKLVGEDVQNYETVEAQQVTYMDHIYAFLWSLEIEGEFGLAVSRFHSPRANLLHRLPCCSYHMVLVVYLQAESNINKSQKG